MKNNYLKIFILIIGLYLFLPFGVKAAQGYSNVKHGYNTMLYNSCVNNHTCMLLCAYSNNVQYTYNNAGVDSKYNNYSAYIYYNFKDSSIFTDWYSQETDLEKAKHSNKITHKYVFFEEKALNNLRRSGVCPNNAYIDIKNISEVCYSNTSTFCTQEKTKGNPGTKFEGTSLKEYDYQTQISNYYKYNSIDTNKFTCDDFRSKKIDVKNLLTTDFSTNFLYGNSIPNFMKNSGAYNIMFKDYQEKFQKLKSRCDTEAKQQLMQIKKEYENGSITEEEYKEAQKKYDEAISQNETALSDLNNQLTEADNKINQGSNGNSELNLEPEELDCQKLLGDPNVEGEPAFYLSKAFEVIKYIAIILLIVMTIMDFLGAVASHDNEILKKATSKVIKRLILCVVIWFLPLLLNLILSYLNNVDGICIS